MQRIILGLIISCSLSSFSAHSLSILPTSKQQTFDISKGFSNIAEKAIPAVVNVSTTQVIDGRIEREQSGIPQDLEDFFKRFFDHMEKPKRVQSLGSGFIIYSDNQKAYIVTNYHVIADAKKITIFLQDKTELDATVHAFDDRTDLAILVVNTESLPANKRSLPILEWSDTVSKVGDWVLALGNPFGLYDSMTLGIISSKGRNILAGQTRSGARADYVDDFIQHDASINMGNSGGPLLNLDGKVIGINTMIYSPSGGNVGIGFAIPSELAKRTIDQLIQFGRTKRGWLGVHVQKVYEDMAESLGLGKVKGAIVAKVTPGSPGEAAGLLSNDIITEYDGKVLDDNTSIQRLVGETPVGKTVNLRFLRRNPQTGQYEEWTTQVVIGEFEEAQKKGLIPSQDKIKTHSSSSQEILGLKLAPLTEEMKRSFRNPPATLKGVMVLRVDPSSTATEVGLRSGDVIIEVNQVPVTSPAEVKNSILESRSMKRKNILLRIWRDDGQEARYVTLKIEPEEENQSTLAPSVPSVPEQPPVPAVPAPLPQQTPPNQPTQP